MQVTNFTKKISNEPLKSSSTQMRSKYSGNLKHRQ